MAGRSAFAMGKGCGETSGAVGVGLLKVLDVADFEALDWGQRDFAGWGPSGWGPTCSGTLISDRLVLTAAHCVAFPRSAANAALIQDEFGVGFRNVFIMDGFQPPAAYNNIALIELNHSINSILSPVCISDGAVDISGMDATYEGYGYTVDSLSYTEEGELSETLKRESVTIIANDVCTDVLKSNNSGHLINNNIDGIKIADGFTIGLTDSLLCTMGKYDEDTDTYSGPCRGDSGGPLYVDHGDRNQKKLTLEGIVGGGVGRCGSNQARWYARVSAHKYWINCIIDGINEEKSKSDIEELCGKEAYAPDFD